jgi:hypothetical protein
MREQSMRAAPAGVPGQPSGYAADPCTPAHWTRPVHSERSDQRRAEPAGPKVSSEAAPPLLTSHALRTKSSAWKDRLARFRRRNVFFDDYYGLGQSSATNRGPLPERSDALDERSDEDCRLILDFTLGIIDRKYQLYEWTETKIGTLVSIDSLIIGGVLVLATQDSFGIGKSFWNKAFFIAPLIVLGVSIMFSLAHTVPKMDSGIGNLSFRNLRQTASTERYSPKEYLEGMSRLTLRDMIVQNSNQIKGMNSIIMTNQRELRRGVLSTILGVALTLVWILSQVI